MKVLYLTPGCFDKGGISRYSRYQIQALREILGGKNVRVLSLLGPDADSLEKPFHVTFHTHGAAPVDKMRFVFAAVREVILWAPAVVWCAHVNFSGLTRMLAKMVRAVSLTNVYGLEVWGKKRLDASWGLQKVNRVVSDCHFTAQYIADHELRLHSEIHVIWDCVDDQLFSPRPARPEVLRDYGIPSLTNGFNILTLGRLARDAEYKGYERLLRVFARVSLDLPDARLIYGGSGNLTESLRRQAEALGLSNRVFFTGSVHEDHLPDIYRSASVFSLVSDRGIGRGEGIPLTPLEAGGLRCADSRGRPRWVARSSCRWSERVLTRPVRFRCPRKCNTRDRNVGGYSQTDVGRGSCED